MSDFNTGVGRLRVELNLQGMSDDDLAMISTVTPILQLPDETLEVFAGAVDMAELLTESKVYYIYDFVDEGRYLLGAKIEFSDGLHSTTYRNQSVVVTDAFASNGGLS